MLLLFMQAHYIPGMNPRHGDWTGTRATRSFLVAVKKDGVEPGRKAARLIVTDEVFPGSYADLGNQILRRAQVIGQSHGLPQQTGFQRSNQQTECLGPTPACGCKKLPLAGSFDQVFPDDHLSINDLS
jgi:hypothetical protein